METLIQAGVQLGTTVLGIIGNAIAGAYKSSEELRADLQKAADEFSAYIAVGGEMDRRRDAARAKTDAAIAKAEHAAPTEDETTKP